MFKNNEMQGRNRIIDGEFISDRYITVQVGGQVHSRKVKKENDLAYIVINDKTYTAEDFINGAEDL